MATNPEQDHHSEKINHATSSKNPRLFFGLEGFAGVEFGCPTGLDPSYFQGGRFGLDFDGVTGAPTLYAEASWMGLVLPFPQVGAGVGYTWAKDDLGLSVHATLGFMGVVRGRVRESHALQLEGGLSIPTFWAEGQPANDMLCPPYLEG